MEKTNRTQYFMVVDNEETNWDEELTKGRNFDAPVSLGDAKVKAEEILEFFNSSLKPHESRRDLISVYQKVTTYTFLD